MIAGVGDVSAGTPLRSIISLMASIGEDMDSDDTGGIIYHGVSTGNSYDLQINKSMYCIFVAKSFNS